MEDLSTTSELPRRARHWWHSSHGGRWQTVQVRWSPSLLISLLPYGCHHVGVLASKRDDLLKPDMSPGIWLCAHRCETPFPHLEAHLR